MSTQSDSIIEDFGENIMTNFNFYRKFALIILNKDFFISGMKINRELKNNI